MQLVPCRKLESSSTGTAGSAQGSGPKPESSQSNPVGDFKLQASKWQDDR